MSRWAAFERELKKLPPLPFSPAPWRLSDSRTSVNLDDGGKIRQEARRDHAVTTANTRLICAAPTMYNALLEAAYTIVLLTGEAPFTEVIAKELGIICDLIAWVHDDPRQGQGLRIALDLPFELPGPEDPHYGRKRVRVTRKSRLQG